MHRHRRIPVPGVIGVITAAALVMLAAAPAASQEPDGRDWYPRPGDWSLGISLAGWPNTGQGGLTLWRQTTQAMALGLDVQAGATVRRPPPDEGGDNDVSVLLALGPALRTYWWSGRPTSPFFLLATHGTWAFSRRPGLDDRVALGLQATVGLGVDWFFTERMSLGAHTGITGRYQTNWTRGEPRDTDLFSIGTGTSALSLQFYF